jgi:hypothetical protein
MISTIRRPILPQIARTPGICLFPLCPWTTHAQVEYVIESVAQERVGKGLRNQDL